MKYHNNFIMTSIESEPSTTRPQKPSSLPNVLRYEQQKRPQLYQFDADNSEFMRPLAQAKNNQQKPPQKVQKSVLLAKQEVQKGLRQIFEYYAKSYDRPVKHLASFSHIQSNKIIMQSYFLFCKNFHILKAIFNTDRLTIIFKKHADYGKYLSFDNFYFMINSMSHQPEAKNFFHLEQMTKNLDIETAEELQRQEFYNYLQLSSPEKYRESFSELFKPFNAQQNPQADKKKYNYRKFSLPQLRKKAIPEPKDIKKVEKDLFILKHDKNIQNNQFDEAKSIVVSWDSLRAKSVNNLGNSEQIVERKYLKLDPEIDPYLEQVRPATKKSPRRIDKRQSKIRRMIEGGKMEQKIKEIQKNEQVKNQKILQRIQKKLNVRSGRKLNI